MPKYQFCIVRTYSAGVYAGYLTKLVDKRAELMNSRGIWYWDGACGLSQLAVDGTTAPDNCKFTVEVPRRKLTEVIEVIPCSMKAMESIRGVKPWKR